jgi:hypothetical protein
VLFHQEERADRNLALAVDGEAVLRRHSTWRHLAGIFILALIGRFLVGIVQHVALAMGSRDIGLLRVVLPVQEYLCVFVERLGIGGFNFAFEAVIDRVGFCRGQLDRTTGSARVCTAGIAGVLCSAGVFAAHGLVAIWTVGVAAELAVTGADSTPAARIFAGITADDRSDVLRVSYGSSLS